MVSWFESEIHAKVPALKVLAAWLLEAMILKMG